MRFNIRLFVILLLAGLAGVLSILLVDPDGLVAILPVQAGTETSTTTPTLKLLSSVQPTIILAAPVAVALAAKAGLSSPLAEAIKFQP